MATPLSQPIRAQYLNVSGPMRGLYSGSGRGRPGAGHSAGRHSSHGHSSLRVSSHCTGRVSFVSMEDLREHFTSYSQRLIDLGAELESPSEERESALLWAVYYGHFKIVKILLEAGADPTVEDPDGNSALQWSKWLNKRAMTKLIKKWIENWNDSQ